MRLEQLAAADVVERLAGPGLALRTGPFNMRVRSRIPAIASTLALLYEHQQLVPDGEFCDCTLDLAPPPGLRRWLRPQVQVRFEGSPLFEPLPLGQAYPLLEWTLNWWISSNAHQYLLLHAAVVARNGRAVILPAPPGSGKSTLCAALTQRGWRLLSDELAMITLDTGQLVGLARPVSLKNQSLHVIRAFEPSAVLSEPAHDTAKGSVAHLRPNATDVEQVDAPAQPAWVVFPRYVAGTDAVLRERSKADAMMELGRNAFNYPLLAMDGFRTLGDLVSSSACFDFSYSRLDDAIEVFERLASSPADA